MLNIISRSFFIVLLLLISFLGESREHYPTALRASFTGSVKDISGKPIEGVNIYFADIKTGTSTDKEGKFSLKSLPDGKHLLEISHVGYKTIAVDIDLVGDMQKDFVLEESVVETNAVIVTGVSNATQSKKTPFQVSVIRKEELMQQPSANIIEALTKKAGVNNLSTGPSIAKPVIRGLGYNRVVTINDGTKQEGQQWGDEHGIEIDEASVSKVEILKGPASIIYGSDAMAGVINIITNVPVQPNTIKANVLSSYQTNNRERLLHAAVAGNIKGFNWNAYTSASAAADYQNKYDGYVFNSKFRQLNSGGYVGYNSDWGFSHLIVSNYNLKTGLVEGERDETGAFIKPTTSGEEKATNNDFLSTNPMIPYQHIRHFKLIWDNSIKLGTKRLLVNVGYQQNKREEFGNIDDLSERELFFDLATITYNAHLQFRESKGWSGSVGVNGMSQNNTNKGVEQLIPDYNLFDAGVFGYVKKSWNKITVSSGLRYDSRNVSLKNLMDGTDIKNPGFDKSFANVSGSLGMSAELSKQFNLKLNVARGFRAPSIPELASNGSHEGTLRYEYGDASLKSETSLQFDAGLDFNTEHISISAAGYYNYFPNFIFYRKLQSYNGGDSVLNVDGNDLTAFKFDQRKAALKGLELTMDFHPHPLDWLHVQNTFSLVSGTFVDAVEGTKYMPFIPATRWITELRGNFKKTGKSIKNLYTKIELDNTFNKENVFTAYNTETVTNGYSLLNAGIGADIVSSHGKTLFSLHIAAMNITDAAYQNHLSRLKYAAENPVTGRTGVFNMGRNFSVKLNIPLSFTVK